MYLEFIDKTVDNFVQNGIIEDENKELYAFGMRQGMTMVLNVATTVVIGAVLGMVWQSLLFMVSFIPLRSFAGGYHARTQLQCYLSSVVLIFISLLAIKFYTEINFIYLGLALLGSILIFFLSPVESKNRPLDETERLVFKKKARTILVIEICVLLLLLCVGWVMAIHCMAISIGILGITVGLGRICQRG